jgi:hypothetical protein
VLLLRGVIPRIEAVAETLLRPLVPALPDLMQEHQMSLTKVSGPGGSLVKMPTLPEGNRSQEHARIRYRMHRIRFRMQLSEDADAAGGQQVSFS